MVIQALHTSHVIYSICLLCLDGGVFLLWWWSFPFGLLLDVYVDKRVVALPQMFLTGSRLPSAPVRSRCCCNYCCCWYCTALTHSCLQHHKTNWRFRRYFSNKNFFLKKCNWEIFIRSLPTTLLQILCELKFSLKVIYKIIIDPDDTCSFGISRHEWVKHGLNIKPNTSKWYSRLCSTWITGLWWTDYGDKAQFCICQWFYNTLFSAECKYWKFSTGSKRNFTLGSWD